MKILSNFFLNAENPPLIHHSIQNSTETNSSPVLTIQSRPLFWEQIILVTTPYTYISDLFQYISTVKKCLTWPAPLTSSGQNFKWAPQLWHMYQKYRTFRLPWFSTPIIKEGTYCDALLYAVFSSFPLYPQSYSQIFSPATLHLSQTKCKGWCFI